MDENSKYANQNHEITEERISRRKRILKRVAIGTGVVAVGTLILFMFHHFTNSVSANVSAQN